MVSQTVQRLLMSWVARVHSFDSYYMQRSRLSVTGPRHTLIATQPPIQQYLSPLPGCKETVRKSQ